MIDKPPPGEPLLDKRLLRTSLLISRTQRCAADISAAGTALSDHGCALVRSIGTRTVVCYITARGEPDTAPLISALQSDGIDLLIPILRPDGDLGWARHAERDHLRPARFGLREPSGLDLGLDALASAGLVFVPALAVDRHGNRLGRGGGSYDRALARLHRLAPDVPVVAVLHDDEIIAAVPTEPHDRPVTGALTPSGFVPLPLADGS